MENKKKNFILDLLLLILGMILMIVLAIGAFSSERSKNDELDYTMELMEQSIKLQQEQIEILKNLQVTIEFKGE